ncbi:hypothetical protein SKAU_G00336380 [Synaphobranchus kaupii]|uniref:Uncharacterized protein n=1 Tax=Synaphobranchus kaupii TaxID=118154 RepID=A0A9Q1EMA8_SYNKA|nr:hypothetical protein SKAU_G00336380 [Synaphobranchus kaupii]
MISCPLKAEKWKHRTPRVLVPVSCHALKFSHKQPPVLGWACGVVDKAAWFYGDASGCLRMFETQIDGGPEKRKQSVTGLCVTSAADRSPGLLCDGSSSESHVSRSLSALLLWPLQGFGRSPFRFH